MEENKQETDSNTIQSQEEVQERSTSMTIEESPNETKNIIQTICLPDTDRLKNVGLIIVDNRNETLINIDPPRSTDDISTIPAPDDDLSEYTTSANGTLPVGPIALSNGTPGYTLTPVSVYQQDQQYPYPTQQGYPQGYPQGNPQTQGYLQPPGYPQSPMYPPGYAPGQGYPPNNPPVHTLRYAEGDLTVLLVDPEVRNRFLRKVFLILTIMLAISTLFIVCSISLEPWKEFFLSPAGQLLFFMSMGGILIVAYFMCCPLVMRTPPVGYSVLLLAMVCYTIIACVFSVTMRTELVFYAFLATSALVLVCLILAYTQFDFTSWLLYLVAVTVVFLILVMCVSLAQVVSGVYMKPLHIALLIIGTVVNCVFLIVELQMVIGGKKVELNEEDYLVGVFLIYTSIMSLLIRMLQLFNILDE